MQAQPDWQQIESALHPLNLALSPAELHGALIGWLAGGGDASGNWLGKVLADDALGTPDSPELTRLRDASIAALEDGGLDFQLLLPDEDTPLEQRGNALFDWCRAFLGGFGLAAGASPPLSEESGEALEDLARLAMAETDSEGGEEDEEAFAEIEEFVRVAVLLLHGDCVLAPRARQSLH